MSYFLSDEEGVDQVRLVDPVGITPPDGSALMVLGDHIAGYTRRGSDGDQMFVEQSASVGDGKLLRFRGTIRGPGTAPPAITIAHENYALADAQTLLLTLDDSGVQQTITFSSADFSNIAAARATEVVDAINAQLTGGTAGLDGEGGLFIATAKTGRRARVAIDGGTAVALSFAELGWFAVIRINGLIYSSVEIRPGEIRDLADMAASLAVGGVPRMRFALELKTK